MTTFAHIGSGIAIAATVQHFVYQDEITPSTILIGALLGLLPDADSLFALLFDKWSPGENMLTHHRYFSHAPLFYVILTGCVWWGTGWKGAVMFLVITLTHLLMDSWSTDDGIMWLWPYRTKQYSLFSMELHTGGIYGISFYLRYIQSPRLIIPEIISLAAGAIAIVRMIIQQY